MRESVLQRKCIDYIKSHYKGLIIAVNIHGGGYANKGFPDLLILGNHTAVLIELKSDSGYTLQPDQRIWKSRLERANTAYVLVKSFEQFKNVIEEFFNEVKPS